MLLFLPKRLRGYLGYRARKSGMSRSQYIEMLLDYDAKQPVNAPPYPHLYTRPQKESK